MTTGSLHGADNFWTNAAGTRSWDHTSANWADPMTWRRPTPAGEIDAAIFGGPATGSVWIHGGGDEAVHARGIRFDVAGVSLQGAGELVLGGGANGSVGSGEIEVIGDASIDVQVSVAAADVLINKTGSGTLFLPGVRFQPEDLLVSEGALSIGNGGATGRFDGSIVNHSVVFFDYSDSTTSSFREASITGTGSVVKKGAGTLNILRSTFAPAGGTTIEAGKLAFVFGRLSGGVPSTIGGDVLNHGILEFDQDESNTDFAGNHSGSGTLVARSRFGTLTVTGDHTHTGGTTVTDASTLAIGAGSTTGSISGNISLSSSSTLIFNRSDASTFSGTTSGAGQLIKRGAGALLVEGDLLHEQGTTIEDGSIVIKSGAFGGSVRNDGHLVFERAEDASFDGVISGTGGVEKRGLGALTLTGSHSFAGALRIEEGAVQLGDGAGWAWIGAPIVNNGTLTLLAGEPSWSSRARLPGSIEGSGELIKRGAEEIQLVGNVRLAGGVRVEEGVLTVERSQTPKEFVADVYLADGARLKMRHGMSYGNVISGAGRLLVDANVTFTEDQEYLGGTHVYSGSLAVGDGGSQGSIRGDVSLEWGTSLKFHRADDFAFDGQITGGGSLRKLGDNQLTLRGENSFSGSTYVEGGALVIGDGGQTGAVSGDIVNDGTVIFDRGDDIAYDGLLSGTGAYLKRGSNTLTVANVDAPSGVFEIPDGTLKVSRPNQGGRLYADVVNDGAVVFEGSGSFSGTLSGSGRVEKRGSGLLGVAGMWQHTGGTLVEEGVLQIGGGGPGMIEGDIVNNGTLRFNNGGTAEARELAGDISGSGKLEVWSQSPLRLSGNNTFAGGTTVSNFSTLIVGDGGTRGMISGPISLSGTLIFDRSDDIGYSHQIGHPSGPIYAKIVKQGAGRLGLSGANLHRGETFIEAGTLALTGDGSIANSISILVNDGASLDVRGLSGGTSYSGSGIELSWRQHLGGRGVVEGNVTAGDGAFVSGIGYQFSSREAQLGTLTVNGDVAFVPGSWLNVSVQGVEDADAQRSRIDVNGTLSFAGDAERPFSIGIGKSEQFDGVGETTWTIASSDSIDAPTLDEPLEITVGADGRGSILGEEHIAFVAYNFSVGDKLSLFRAGGELKVDYTPAPLPGDFNSDWIVDGDDLDAWKTGYGAQSDVDRFDGDADGNGVVDGADFLVWQRGFAPPFNAGAVRSGGAVPEPDSAMLLIGLATMLAPVRRHRLLAAA